MWARAVATVIGGVAVKTLSPKKTLLHLCLHVCKHELIPGLRSYCDIAETARRYSSDLDWVAVTERALQGGVDAFVHLPLALARELLDAPVPHAVLDRLDPAGLGRDVVISATDAIADHPHHVWLFPGIFTLRSGDASVSGALAGQGLVARMLCLPGTTCREGRFGSGGDTLNASPIYVARTGPRSGSSCAAAGAPSRKSGAARS